MKIEFEYNEENKRKVELFINDYKEGYIEISEDCIEYVEINKDFKGLGLYTKLIKKALELSGLDSLRSCQRNEDSNPIWEHWTNEELEITDNCYVCLDDHCKNGLWFCKEEL